jgi:mono/diheme cytochrome c family protein
MFFPNQFSSKINGSAAALAAIFSLLFAAAAEPAPFQITPEVAELLDQYCIDCHEEGREKGKFRLDNLAELPLDARLDVMNRMIEKVHFEEMPPKKKDQPTEEERKQLENWLASVLEANNSSKLADKLRMPDYGNKLDHDKLFSGKYKDLPGFTPDRRWLVSEFIFDAKMNKLLEFVGQRDIDGKRYQVIGENNRNGAKVNLTNPFLLPTHSGVRYYDTTTLDGGHLLTMLTNGKELSAYMMSRAKNRTYVPAIYAIMGPKWEHEKILTDRATYLNANIEPLLLEVFKDKHDAMLPKFTATKPSPPVKVGPDGKPINLPGFDYAGMSNEDRNEIWAAIRRYSRDGKMDEAMIVRSERDWVNAGLSEREIVVRVNYVRIYMDEFFKRMPKTVPAAPKPPAEAELAVMRAALLKHRKAGDNFSIIIAKCISDWSDEFRREREKSGTTDQQIGNLVDQLFKKIIERSPDSQEFAEYSALVKSYVLKSGGEAAIEKLIQTLILRTDYVYRQEFGEGEADEHGRRMLSPRDASYALAYALTDSSPDKELAEAAAGGKLNTREDYRREVERMLKIRSQYYIIDESVELLSADSFTNIPIRKLRFFREFFGYQRALPIFKDNKRFGGDYISVSGRAVSEADMLVEHILEQDKNVFEKLLTTEDFFVYHSGNNEEMAKSSAYVRKIYDYFKDKDWRNFDAAKMKEHLAFFKENEVRGVNPDVVAKSTGGKESMGGFLSTMSSYEDLLGKGQTHAVPFSSTQGHGRTEAMTRTKKQMRGPEIAKAFNIDLKNWNYPTTQPTKMAHRKGILTHPAWLIAFAANTETDPIRRGKWVREKLLAGTVPDVPITVDAVIPEDHHNTLRTRLEKKTKEEYCWGCHERMNPVGLPFEMYDDFGRYRMEEFLEHPDNLIKKNPDKGPPQEDLRDIYKTLPVDAKGKLVGTDDPKLDGDVKDAIDMIDRLGKSSKVRQSIIRHAFRFFMGRNETLSDSKTLIDADQAYVQSGGSFDAVIISLLTSDSFIYRKPVTQ